MVGWLGAHPWNRSAGYIVFVGADPDIHLPGFIGETAAARATIALSSPL